MVCIWDCNLWLTKMIEFYDVNCSMMPTASIHQPRSELKNGVGGYALFRDSENDKNVEDHVVVGQEIWIKGNV